jgi:hypothetical protein
MQTSLKPEMALFKSEKVAKETAALSKPRPSRCHGTRACSRDTTHVNTTNYT